MELDDRTPKWNPALRGIVYLAVAVLLLGWLLNTPAGLLGKADAVGYAVCHRIDLRSFHLGERQLPLCARCSGMYLGAMLALGFQAWRAPRRSGMPPRSILALSGIFVLAFALDGINSFISILPDAPQLYAPQNWLRLATGTGMGLAIALLLYPAFNQTVWRKPDYRPAISGWRVMLALLGPAVLVDLALLSEIPALLYPLALVSAAGVLVLLTMAYTMICLLLFKRTNRAERWQSLLLPLCVGFGIALLQIALLDVLRFWLTGTWDGFHLG